MAESSEVGGEGWGRGRGEANYNDSQKSVAFFAILILWCQHTKTARILTIYHFPAGIFSNPPSPPIPPPPPPPDLDCINANFRHIYEEP